MAIGRSDVRHTQRGHTAREGRYGVWAPGAEPIWASGEVPRKKAGHTTAIAPVAKSRSSPLHQGAVHTRDPRMSQRPVNQTLSGSLVECSGVHVVAVN